MWEKTHRYPQILDPPDIEEEIYQIRCGHNRVSAIRTLGYDEIHCFVTDSLMEAGNKCKEQMRWFKRTYGNLV